MNIRKAERKQAKIRLALQGPSGSGKTYSSLLIAKGLVENWSKIVIIDTENFSADLYAHLGSFNVLSITPPYSPEKYIEAITTCVEAGMEVIIIDSISHEWDGEGGILDIHGNMMGNSFTNWSKVTPRHNRFVQHILQCPVHVLATIRSKQDWVLNQKDGKYIPEKMGLKGVTRDGMDYEFTTVLELNIKHFATSSKDRTGLFADKPEFVPREETGKAIKTWCEQGSVVSDLKEAEQRIAECKSIKELVNVYDLYPELRKDLLNRFKQRKAELQSQQNQITTTKLSDNGTDDNNLQG
jgi:hypothetical protein